MTIELTQEEICASCDYKVNHDGEDHCYMFEERMDQCGQYSPCERVAGNVPKIIKMFSHVNDLIKCGNYTQAREMMLTSESLFKVEE